MTKNNRLSQNSFMSKVYGKTRMLKKWPKTKQNTKRLQNDRNVVTMHADATSLQQQNDSL
jgi:hypothetical protein